jgi:hypothetical protein
MSVLSQYSASFTVVPVPTDNILGTKVSLFSPLSQAASASIFCSLYSHEEMIISIADALCKIWVPTYLPLSHHTNHIIIIIVVVVVVVIIIADEYKVQISGKR